MRSMQIGKVIAKYRKQRGMTQEELASHFGVTKPAVSKWESGQSYPDITLLPVMASFFSISVDELLDYQPQMDRDCIRKTYGELCEAFRKEGFAATYERCNALIKKYYSCWMLLLNLAILLLNHVDLAKEEQRNEVLDQILDLSQRVEEQSQDKMMARMAMVLQATVYNVRNEPEEVIDLMQDYVEVPLGMEVLLGSAYEARGEVDRAKTLVQTHLYLALVDILSTLPYYLHLIADDGKLLDAWNKGMRGFIDGFDFEAVHPILVLSAYLSLAQLALRRKEVDRALDALGDVVRVLQRPDVWPLELKGAGLFDRVDTFIDSLDLGRMSPRSEGAILESLRDAMTESGPFAALANHPRFEAYRQAIATVVEAHGKSG